MEQSRVGEKAARQVAGIIAAAEKAAEEIERDARERAQYSVTGRVERAEVAADELVAHAEALSEGLRKLGELLTDQGERILRDTRRTRKQLLAQMDAAIEGELPSPPSRERPRSTA